MAKMNFSVPGDVKTAFDETFRGENKSRVLSELMREAVEEKRLAQRRVRAIDQLLALRKRAPKVSEEKRRAAREVLRGD